MKRVAMLVSFAAILASFSSPVFAEDKAVRVFIPEEFNAQREEYFKACVEKENAERSTSGKPRIEIVSENVFRGKKLARRLAVGAGGVLAGSVFAQRADTIGGVFTNKRVAGEVAGLVAAGMDAHEQAAAHAIGACIQQREVTERQEEAMRRTMEMQEAMMRRQAEIQEEVRREAEKKAQEEPQAQPQE